MSTPRIARPGDNFTHDPDAALIYGMDWEDWLPVGAAISVSAWDVSGDDLLLVKSNEATDGDINTVLLTGGTVGTVYTVRNRITTNETPPQIDDRSFTVTIGER